MPNYILIHHHQLYRIEKTLAIWVSAGDIIQSHDLAKMMFPLRINFLNYIFFSPPLYVLVTVYLIIDYIEK